MLCRSMVSALRSDVIPSRTGGMGDWSKSCEWEKFTAVKFTSFQSQ